MAIFDQRGQRVKYQYNAAGDINIGEIKNRESLVAEMRKLKKEVNGAAEAGLIDQEKQTDANYQIEKAALQAENSKPEKAKILEYIGNAKDILESVAGIAGSAGGLLNAFTQVGDLVKSLF